MEINSKIKIMEKIEEQRDKVNDLFNKAVTDDDWSNWNTEWIRLGQMINEYNRVKYIRKMKILIPLVIFP